MFILPESYNVLLTFSPIEEITGHWFEVFEYYCLLKENNLSPFMLFHSPSLSKEEIISSLESKYNVPIPVEDIHVLTEIEHLIASPFAVALVCDGNFYSMEHYGIKILAKKILGFGCGDIRRPYGMYKDAVFLLDKRVYPDVSYNVINYTKKIFSELLLRPVNRKHNTLYYLTNNCRSMSLLDLQNAILEYNDYDEHIIVTPEIERYSSLKCNNIKFVKPPLINMFNEFDTYVYTPVPRHFDCSPRLIAECALFERKVEYYHIDYFDRGLEVRRKDIESGYVWMKKDDEIVDIIKRFL